MTTTRETEEEGEGGMVSRRESASAEKSEFSEKDVHLNYYTTYCVTQNIQVAPVCVSSVYFYPYRNHCQCNCILIHIIYNTWTMLHIPVAVPFWI